MRLGSAINWWLRTNLSAKYLMKLLAIDAVTSNLIAQRWLIYGCQPYCHWTTPTEHCN